MINYKNNIAHQPLSYEECSQHIFSQMGEVLLKDKSFDILSILREWLLNANH